MSFRRGVKEIKIIGDRRERDGECRRRSTVDFRFRDRGHNPEPLGDKERVNVCLCDEATRKFS